jgi:hypothetical protein
VRGGAQTAADAAALGAARAGRDELTTDFTTALGSGDLTAIGGLLGGDGLTGGCGADEQSAAEGYAQANGAEVTSCTGPAPLTYHVAVRTTGTVGHSLVPGTDSVLATARATAVVAPRCSLAPGQGDDGGSGDGGSSGSSGDGGSASGGGASSGGGSDDGGTGANGGSGDGGSGAGGSHAHPVTFSCDTGDLTIDPTRSDFRLDLADFFSVHLSK